MGCTGLCCFNILISEFYLQGQPGKVFVSLQRLNLEEIYSNKNNNCQVRQKYFLKKEKYFMLFSAVNCYHYYILHQWTSKENLPPIFTCVFNLTSVVCFFPACVLTSVPCGIIKHRSCFVLVSLFEYIIYIFILFRLAEGNLHLENIEYSNFHSS